MTIRSIEFASLSALLVALGLLGGAASAWGAEAEIEALETCFVVPPDEVATQIGAFDCGYVVVPENHEAPDGSRVRLGFVRLPRDARGGDPGRCERALRA